MAGLSRAERQRRRYRPDDVRVLFIGESLPAGGTFFYYGNSKLYEATKEAFEAAIPTLRRNHDFLTAFQQLGCYLEDLASIPVNGMPDDAREQACDDGVRALARRIKPYSPLVVTLVIKRIAVPAARALRQAQLDGVPLEKLPFPNWPKQHETYTAELAALVRSWARRGVLHRL
jgi:hypothetical protein